ncbi:hypothetical protein BJV78DRAFT_271073 [Lactifluus subvellereus]|nr:hypothetical protein BJV78DRAFT_271073 [Lactifluus subvellereus]
MIKCPSSSTLPPSLDSDPHQVILNCLMLREPTSHVFPVQISSTKTVGNLKEVIKEKNQLTFQHFDARSLVLWEVSIHPDQPVPQNFDELQVDVNDVTQLLPRARLSDVFSEPLNPTYLHVIVESPTLGE